jgi:hypothetical protein
MKPIDHVSEQLAEYCRDLAQQRNLEKLQTFLEGYVTICPDALAVMPRDDGEFFAFREGLYKERKKIFAGVKWANRFGAIAMPALLLRVGLIANEYQVPWGLAFQRCVEMNLIKHGADGVAEWIGPVEPAQEKAA